MKVPDVDDDDADAQLEQNAGDEQREDEVVEAMTETTDVEE